VSSDSELCGTADGSGNAVDTNIIIAVVVAVAVVVSIVIVIVIVIVRRSR